MLLVIEGIEDADVFIWMWTSYHPNQKYQNPNVEIVKGDERRVSEQVGTGHTLATPYRFRISITHWK